MGATGLIDERHPRFEIPVQRVQAKQQYGTGHAQEQATSGLISAQDDIAGDEPMPQDEIHRKRYVVPIWAKVLLSLEEAAEYTGLGMQRLRNISSDESCGFVLWNGTKRMFKRRKLEAYLENEYSI